MKYWIPLICLLMACTPENKSALSSPTQSVQTALNNWHKAAAEGDYEVYFDFFEDSASIFMGTDATEYWTKSEFAIWSIEPFSDGSAWDFTAFNRHVYYSPDSSIAWFDEELNTPTSGTLRGSGVLKAVGDQWKIAHYNLSMPIPNEIYYDVRDLIMALDSIKTTE